MAPTLAKRFIRRSYRAHRACARVKDSICRSWTWVRFGKITETVKSVDGGVVSEIEYRGRSGKVIGYWAYGHFDPTGPYRG
jgi:hypothetical protein